MGQVYFGNLGSDFTTQDLRDELRPYCTLRSVSIHGDPEKLRAFSAIVRFRDLRDALNAVRNLNGKNGWHVKHHWPLEHTSSSNERHDELRIPERRSPVRRRTPERRGNGGFSRSPSGRRSPVRRSRTPERRSPSRGRSPVRRRRTPERRDNHRFSRSPSGRRSPVRRRRAPKRRRSHGFTRSPSYHRRPRCD